MVYVELVVGLALLLAGGEFLVRGAVAVARRLGVSPLMIGLTLVGFGTSTPELMASVQAALAGSPGIAVGNVVGSNIANILLILGLTAVIAAVPVAQGAFKRDGTVLILATLLCCGFVLLGHFDRITGAVFVAALIGYIVFTYRAERTHMEKGEPLDHPVEVEQTAPPALALSLLMAIGGLGAVMYGATLLVDGAILLAKGFGVSDEVIGLTLVAVGTSLPELVTSVMAAIRKQPDVAFGNIVGSNIYNILGILGVTALVQPIDAPPQIAAFDTWYMLAVTLLLILFSVTAAKIKRWEGGVFIGLYVLYLGFQINPTLRGLVGLNGA